MPVRGQLRPARCSSASILISDRLSWEWLMGAGNSATPEAKRLSQALGNTVDALRAQFHGQKSAAHGQFGRWFAFAVWACVMCALGAAYVYAVVGRLHLVTVAFWLALGASACLGTLAGGLRDRNLLLTACMIGTLILTAALECGWVATVFVPVAGDSGGVGEIVAPFFLAVIGIPFFLGVMAVVLGVANLFGLAVVWHRRPSRPAP
jgi:hypothetical protein